MACPEVVGGMVERLMVACLIGILAVAPLGTAGDAGSKALESRVEAALKRLTVDEKIALIGGVEGFNLAPNAKLGLPKILMSDGPAGVRNFGPTTAYPAPVGLAASFDPELARQFGVAIGQDARARGVGIWLGPGVNLSRVPQNGRNFEYLGEDPWLAGITAAEIIKGVQSQGVVATIKHFAANEHETDRDNDSSEVDERTLRDLYLKPFEIAIKEGKPWAVMCSYNLLNGIHTSEHEWLLNTVLKKEWGFPGIVMSDWGAVHSALGPALHGLDLEMPGPDFMNAANLKPMLKDGRLPIAKIDDKVRRILRMEFAMGFLDRSQKDASIPLDNPKTAAVALKIAREGTVLLKNAHNALPLDAKKIRRVLVIGPNAAPPATGGGGSSYTTPFRSVDMASAIRAVAPGVEVHTVASPAGLTLKALHLEGLLQGKWRAEYWNNPIFREEAVFTFDEDAIDHVWSGNPPVPGMSKYGFAVRWTGTVVAPRTGDYLMTVRSDDGIRVLVDGRKIIDDWRDRAVDQTQGMVKLQKGQCATIVVEYFQRGGEAIAQFGMQSRDEMIEDMVPAKELAEADAVIACVGFNGDREGEGHDRPFALPAGQDELIERLSSHPRVIVVNNSGAGVDMTRWVDKVAGIIQAWYPGQNGNQAVAEILFGKVNPSGKLPTTFPRTLAGTYYAKAYPAEHPKMVYREGQLMGYRWFDANQAKPLFPFGFGLSYSKFKIEEVKGFRTGPSLVPVRVTNLGDQAGVETVQLYVERKKRSAKLPLRELVSYQRVALEPGESKVVRLPLRNGYTSTDANTTVRIGTSSADLPIRPWGF
jgi:beta-glucosidase